MSGQIEAGIQPTLFHQVSVEGVFQHWFWSESAGFKHLRFKPHQHGSSKKGFAALG
jgi:hypothetical protein